MKEDKPAMSKRYFWLPLEIQKVRKLTKDLHVGGVRFVGLDVGDGVRFVDLGDIDGKRLVEVRNYIVHGYRHEEIIARFLQGDAFQTPPVVSKPRPRIQVVPGASATRLLQWVFPRKQFEHIFAPQIADLQYEYIAALDEGRPRKAMWIRARFVLELLSSLLLMLPLHLLKVFMEIWKAG